MLKRFLLFLSFMLFVVFGAVAFAAVPAEITTVATAVKTDGPLTVASIGGAILTMAGVAVLFKWAKATMFS